MARTEDEHLDVLRRRLYRPDATAEDRERYDELRARAVPDPVPLADPTSDEPLPPAPPSRRRPVRTAAAVVGVLALGAVAAVLSIPPAATPSADRSPAATRVPRPDPSQPTPVAVSVGGVATTAQRFHGRGPAVVPLITGSAPPNGGRLVVVLTSDEVAPLGWTAARWGSIGSGPSTPQVLASSPRQQRSGLGRPETTEYGGDPPADIAVSDPGSHAWTLTVLILDPAS